MLPEAKDLPVLYRSKHPANAAPRQPATLQPEPTDAQYIQIKEVASRPLAIDAAAGKHKLTIASERVLRQVGTDSRGILQPNWECLDIRVSKDSLARALEIMNAIILALER